jgi:hypothetical protein
VHEIGAAIRHNNGRWLRRPGVHMAIDTLHFRDETRAMALPVYLKNSTITWIGLTLALQQDFNLFHISQTNFSDILTFTELL